MGSLFRCHCFRVRVTVVFSLESFCLFPLLLSRSVGTLFALVFLSTFVFSPLYRLSLSSSGF